MRPTTLRHLLISILAAAVSVGAAPAPPSYYVVERTIGKIRTDWAKPGSKSQPNASGWNALFDATLADLRGYTAATTEDDRLAALSSLYQESLATASPPWAGLPPLSCAKRRMNGSEPARPVGLGRAPTGRLGFTACPPSSRPER